LFQEAFKAFHTNMGKVSKYMTPLNIGSVGTPCKVDEEEMRKDFVKLRKNAEDMVGRLAVSMFQNKLFIPMASIILF